MGSLVIPRPRSIDLSTVDNFREMPRPYDVQPHHPIDSRLLVLQGEKDVALGRGLSGHSSARPGRTRWTGCRISTVCLQSVIIIIAMARMRSS